MEDYTYHLVPGEEKILGAHMLEVCPTHHAQAALARDPPAGHRRPGGPGPAALHADPGPGVVAGLSDLGDRFRLTVNEIDVVEPDEPTCRSCRWPARSGSRDPSWRTSAEAWLMAGGPHHTVLSTAVGVEVLEDFAEMTRVELLVIDADTTPRGFQRELRWNAAYYRLAARL